MTRTGLKKTVLIASEAGVERRDDSIIIDRKFHEGMLEYAKRLEKPLACIVPASTPGMGAIAIPDSAVPYTVHVIPRDTATAERTKLIRDAIDQAALVYVGISGALCIPVAEMCHERGVAYVGISEYTLQTEIDIMRAGTSTSLRRLVREFKLRMRHRRKLRTVARAAELHANGYPTFLELAHVNPRRLMYFDTRAHAADIIAATELTHRLTSRSSRPARLLYSGRFNEMKGALDVVKTGIELARRGCRFQLDMYGSGPLKQQMVDLVDASGTGGSVRIHDPVPYDPTLIEVTRNCDLFLCCHVQGDPSCTYLETFACGVPIVGYANEMWAPLCEESRGGEMVPVGDFRAMASCVLEILADEERLGAASLRAREFALTHTMERAWDDRTSRLSALLTKSGHDATADIR